MATIPGTEGDDILVGTADADLIDGKAGDDRLNGGAGDDELLGGLGGDVLVGGTGVDRMDGGAGRDAVNYAGLAADESGRGIFVNLQDGVVTSPVAGDDVLSDIEDVIGTDHDDYLIGGYGAGKVTGGMGRDYLFGSGGRDVIYGGAGDDDIRGDYGVGDGDYNTSDDSPAPAGAADRILGGAGRDLIEGDEGDDLLSGGGGDDELQGELGSDVLHGGAGRDRFVYLSADGFQTNRFENGLDIIEDFTRGKDEIAYEILNLDGDRLGAFEEPDSGIVDLDSNGNDVLDDGDLYVEIEAVTHKGVTRQSTVIDTADFTDFDTGEHTLVVFGATGLTQDDFAF